MAISPNSTLVDYLVPSRTSRSINLLRDVLLVVGFSIFTGLCAQVSFHIPITPVPITLQTLAVLLTGAALGSRRGGLAMLVYLAEGAAGLPVFAGGSGGVFYLVGFSSGYFWGCSISAFLTGLPFEPPLDRSIFTSALAMLPGTLIIYALGVSWLAVVLSLNPLKAFTLGMLPFIPGDILKLVIAAALLPVAWTIVRRVKPEKE